MKINLIVMKKTIFLFSLILLLFFTLASCVKKNHAPNIADQNFILDENSVAGTVAGTVVANDEEDAALTYSIVSGNTGDAFSISETSGEITVKTEAALDFEVTPEFTLIIEAKDSKQKGSVADITIRLNDIQISTEGMILYLPFNGNVNDLSPNGNNGIDYTMHNYVAGKKSQALDFNGTTDYVVLSNTLDSRNGLSFSFWLKTRGANATQNNGSIISKYSKINNTRCFMVYSFGSYETRSDDRLSAAFYADGYSSAYHDMSKSYLEPADISVYPNPSLWTILNPLRLARDQWTQCVVNLTPTTIEIWINDMLCTKKTREYNSYSTSFSEPVMIGNNYDIGEGTNNHFNGQLDEFRVYNRALTNAEIKTLFKE
jgi:hypothetical protein